MTRPNFLSPGLIERDARGNPVLSKALADYLTELGSTTTDAGVAASIADLLARMTVLEDEPPISIVGDGVAITVYGSAEDGYQIHFTGGSTDPLVCQIFGS